MKGKAAVFLGPERPLEIREYTVNPPGPDEILVRISRCNICGSDLHVLKGHGPPGIVEGTPQILGHEMMGTVYALGANVKTDYAGVPLKEGDRVAYAYFRPCGRCWACISGTAACLVRYAHWLGVSAETPPHFNGAFGEYYYIGPRQWVYKVPDELEDDVVSPINCALSEVLYGLHRVGITLGDTVVIQGAGGLGLYATAVAREMGAGKVIVLDMQEERLVLALEFGAHYILDISQMLDEERVAKVKELSGGDGADVVAELTGSPHAVAEGMNMLRPGGRYLMIGNINLGLATEFDPAVAVRGSKRMVGVIVYEAWVIPRALDFLVRCAGKYPFHKVISHSYSLDEINEAVEFASKGKSIRVTLIP
jgi:D-arabinose 1-dehydrogenase-like Zn-dependent alcohol dehydrogenase